MLIPLGTDRPLARKTVVTHLLIVVTVAAFIGQYAARQFALDWWGPIEMDLLIWRRNFHWWALLSHAFLHGSFMHIAGNMLFLWVFGPNIEDRFGRLGFLVFYLLGAAAAGGVHIAFDSHPALGASGAIAACTGAYLIMFPHTTVRVLSLLFVIGLLQVPAWWFVGLSVAWDILAQSAGSQGVAHMAHLGGYAYGAVVGFVLLWTRVLPREPYDVFSAARQAYRRRQIRSAATGRERELEQRRQRIAAPGRERHSAEEAARVERLAAARAEIVRLISAGSLAEAGAAYKSLAEEYAAGSSPETTEGSDREGRSGERSGGDGGFGGGATLLSRRHMYELANYFYISGDQRAAVYTYERFLEGYPSDPEAPEVRLLLGRLNARYLNDPVRAKALLKEAIPGLRDAQVREMAERELEALG